MPKPAYALVGDDSFMQMEKLREIIAQFPADVQRFDLDGETADLADVFDELRSFSMFGGHKVVVLRNADEFISNHRPQMEDYLKRPVDSATLVLRVASLPKPTLVYKAINKMGGIEECKPLEPFAIVGWITKRAQSVHKISLAPAAANLLAERIGTDRARLDNELAKLALASDTGKIDLNDVAGSVTFQREQELWDITNALAEGKPAEALRRWRHLTELDKNAEYLAVGTFSRWLGDVGLAIDTNAGPLAWKYKDKFPIFLKNAKQLGPKRYARALDMLTDIDRRSKSGLGETTEHIERFILTFNA